MYVIHVKLIKYKQNGFCFNFSFRDCFCSNIYSNESQLNSHPFLPTQTQMIGMRPAVSTDPGSDPFRTELTILPWLHYTREGLASGMFLKWSAPLILHRPSGEGEGKVVEVKQEAFPAIKTTHKESSVSLCWMAIPPCIFYAPPQARWAQIFDPYPWGILLKRS